MDYAQLFRLDGKVALVIGAASGLGHASSRALAAHGAWVVTADINREGAEEAARLIARDGGRAEADRVDVTQEEDVARLFRTVADRHPTLDVLVVAPGINVRKPVANYTTEELDRVLTVNLKGTFYCLREAARRMADQGSGSIIAFSSIRAQVVEPGQSVYSATKAGVAQMVRALAAELGPRGVRANAIAPGVVETALTRPITAHPEWYQAYAARTALGRWATPDDIAGAVVFLASDAARYVTGSVLVVDGGWTAIDGRYTPPL